MAGKSKSFFSGLCIGAIAGSVYGILFSTKKGEQIRKAIIKAKKENEDVFKILINEMGLSINEAKKVLSEYISSAEIKEKFEHFKDEAKKQSNQFYQSCKKEGTKIYKDVSKKGKKVQKDLTKKAKKVQKDLTKKAKNVAKKAKDNIQNLK